MWILDEPIRDALIYKGEIAGQVIDGRKRFERATLKHMLEASLSDEDED